MSKTRIEIFTTWNWHAKSPFAWTQSVVVEGADELGLLAIRRDGSVVVLLNRETLAEWPAGSAPPGPGTVDPFSLPPHETVEFAPYRSKTS